MQKTMLSMALGMTALSIAVISPAIATDSADRTMRHTQATFTSGGVGNQSQTSLNEKQMDEQYNLKVTTAYSTGHYLARVDIQVQDQQGNTVINTETQGPLFYAKLQPGTYRVVANYQNDQKQDTVRISTHTNLREIVFHWDPNQPVNG